MTASGFNKAGWHWTRKGWKRLPKRIAAVKKAPMLPKKRRPFKVQRIAPAAKRQARAIPEASQIALEQGRAVSAPTLAPKPEERTGEEPRKTWRGKYDRLKPDDPA